MRNYQTKANVGGAADSITTTKYGAGEFNSLAQENEAAVSRSGQTPAPADGTGEDTTQLAQSLFLHSVKAASFQAGGSVDAITLTPVSGSSGVLLPSSYDNMEGAMISFVPSGANTGAVTVSIGQTSGTQLATKKLLDASGSALSGGELGTDRIEIYYDPSADSSNGAWLLTPWSTSSGGGGGGGGSELPTGSIYINYDSATNPATSLGYGTWVAIQDRMLIGAGGSYSATATGGSATTTLSSGNVPNMNIPSTTSNGTVNTADQSYFSNTGALSAGMSLNVSNTSHSTSGGGSSAATTISPYIAVYIWRRTA